MAILNIPLDGNFVNDIKTYILQKFSSNFPDFSKILIFTPSQNTAKMLKQAFASGTIIIPKILPISEVGLEFLLENNIKISTELEQQEISNESAKLLLFAIVKRYFPNFSENSIFSYIEDFLELETLCITNKTDFLDVIAKQEGVILNMAHNLRHSLINFLKIFQEWQGFKAQHRICTRIEANFAIIQELIKFEFSNFNAVFLAYFQGSNVLQIELMRKINSLKHGYVVLSGLEDRGFFSLATQSLHNLLPQISSKGYNQICDEKTRKPNYFIMEFENILAQAKNIFLHVKYIMQNLEKSSKIPKFGIVCYNSKTGLLLEEMFAKEGIKTSTTFTKSLQESAIFQAFELFLQSEDLACYLSLIKSKLMDFEQEKIANFEAELRKPNLNAKRPFQLHPETQNLNTALTEFKKILRENIRLSHEFLKFEEFINFIIAESEGPLLKKNGFTLNKSLISSFAKNLKFAKMASNNLFILSSIEARGMNFDHLFITDVSAGNLPSQASQNKILNLHLQKLLEIAKEHEQFEWLDFAHLLNSSANIFASYTKTSFEEATQSAASPFLMHAMECLPFASFEKKFAEKTPIINLEFPKFKPDFWPKTLTPTSFERLVNNPFSFYVENILKIRSLNPISNELEKKDLGIILHKAIENFFKTGEDIKHYCKNILSKTGFFYEFLLYEEALAQVSEFFKNDSKHCAKNYEKKPELSKVIMEEFIKTELKLPQNIAIKLEARPDRVEFYEDEIKVIDYKVYSGKITKQEVLTGKKPQLSFQALILSLLYPEFKGKFTLSYYFINLNSAVGAIEVLEFPAPNLEIVKISIEKLLFELQHFFYKGDGANNFYKHLVRGYE